MPTMTMMGALEGVPLGDVLGGGAYDTIDCCEAIHDLGESPVIPPNKNTKGQMRGRIPTLVERNNDQRNTVLQ